MSTSTIQLLSADNTSSPFLDLPGEIRNNIYGYLLCGFRDPEPSYEHFTVAEYSNVHFDVHLNILQTCRQIHREGTDLMRKTNLLVMVEFQESFFNKLSMFFRNLRLPIVDYWTSGAISNLAQLDNRGGLHKQGYVITHKIRTLRNNADTTSKLVLLHRHLPCLCRALKLWQWVCGSPDEALRHNITVHDTFYHRNQAQVSSLFDTEAIIEGRISPYRSILKGLPKFEISGSLSDDLKTKVISEIRGTPTLTYGHKLLGDALEFQRLGNQFIGRANLDAADCYLDAADCYKFTLCILGNVMRSQTASEIRRAGGDNFCSQVVQKIFTLCSDIAQTYINEMRLQRNIEDSYMLVEMVHDMIYVASESQREYCKYWEPSPIQHARIQYEDAVACRLSGIPPYVFRAVERIDEALRVLPGDRRLLAEKARIDIWRRACLMSGLL